jgi:HAD superfamily hydrolase (TIGR01549 family)
VLATVNALLFDFDGPVCELFAHYSPKVTAAEARSEFAKNGIVLPAELQRTSGALALLQWSELNVPHMTPVIEDIQEKGEFHAARTASPTPHLMAAVISARQREIKVAIVSNNSPDVIREYLSVHHLESYFDLVSGRIKGDIGSMKPCPGPLLNAASALGVPIGRCAMIGDSVTDIDAANQAGAQSIGYAPEKSAASVLSKAGADVIVDSMAVLASALYNSPQVA